MQFNGSQDKETYAATPRLRTVHPIAHQVLDGLELEVGAGIGAVIDIHASHELSDGAVLSVLEPVMKFLQQTPDS